MKEILYFCFDLIDYTSLGLLLMYLLKDTVAKRFCKSGFGTFVFMWLQFVGVRMSMGYVRWVKQLIYGNEMYIAYSGQSIVPVAFSMACTILAGLILYRGSRMKLLSLITVYYALWELVRFMLYPLMTKSIDLVAENYKYLLLGSQTADMEQYQKIMENAEIIWNAVSLSAVFLLLFFCICKFRKYLSFGKISCEMGDGGFYRRQEAVLVFVPGLLGLVFACMLRTILFYYDKEMHSIIKEYPELNLIIPLLSLLCIVSVLLSAKTIGEIKKEHEKRLRAELYQSRAEELEAHVRDMESIHVQIRGMKHDMKNYIADINALLAGMVSGDESVCAEIHRYVDSMQASLESMDMKYQTKNPVTDVILGRYARLARQKNISFSSDFVYPGHLGIDVFDMSILLNNGLENAFEACENEKGEMFVGLYAKQKGNMLLLTIENSFTGILKWEEEFPKSKKAGDEHGLGLKNMKACAEKYYGKIDVRTEDDRFYTVIMLQGNQKIDDRK